MLGLDLIHVSEREPWWLCKNNVYWNYEYFASFLTNITCNHIYRYLRHANLLFYATLECPKHIPITPRRRFTIYSVHRVEVTMIYGWIILRSYIIHHISLIGPIVDPTAKRGTLSTKWSIHGAVCACVCACVVSIRSHYSTPASNNMSVCVVWQLSGAVRILIDFGSDQTLALHHGIKVCNWPKASVEPTTVLIL